MKCRYNNASMIAAQSGDRLVFGTSERRTEAGFPGNFDGLKPQSLTRGFICLS